MLNDKFPAGPCIVSDDYPEFSHIANKQILPHHQLYA